jgi:hypothetical protein
MGRYFTVQFTAVGLTAAADLFEITCASERPIRVWGWSLFQTTDLGDANEEVLALTLERGVTAGSGGTSVTPVSMDRESSADSTANRTVTTAHTNGTVVWRRGWNIRIPDEFWFTPETAPTMDSATDPVTLTMSAPADSITVSGLMLFEEL